MWVGIKDNEGDGNRKEGMKCEMLQEIKKTGVPQGDDSVPRCLMVCLRSLLGTSTVWAYGEEENRGGKAAARGESV